MEAYLAERPIDVARLKAAIRKATLDISMTPVLCGSSFKNKGVQPLLDAVLDYLPSPLDVPPVEGLEPVQRRGRGPNGHARRRRRRAVLGARLQGHVRPVRRQAHLLPRLLRQARRGRPRAQPITGRTERVGRILMMHANDREEPGDLRGRHRRGRRPQADVHRRHAGAPDAPIVLETITFPEPVVHVSIEPKTKADQEKMGSPSRASAEEDPTFQVAPTRRPARPDLGHGRAAPRGIVDRMKREFKVEAASAARRCLPRDRARRGQEGRGQVHPPDRRLGPVRRGLHRLEPAPGEGFDFVNKIKGGSIPSEFIPAVEKGIEEALETASRPASRWSTCASTLTDGKYHDTDSSEIAFKIAGSMALKAAASAPSPCCSSRSWPSRSSRRRTSSAT